MELTNRFRVAAPIDEAWALLTDVEAIAPCMPGAQLTEVEGEEYRGVVKVKVGPITAQYRGAAHFVERDDTAHRAVVRAQGRETRGQGNASATVTAQLTPDGDGTAVEVVTDLTITGRVAQFGRGVLADVSAKLIDEFASRLQAQLAEPAPADGHPADPAAAAAASPTTPSPTSASSPAAEPTSGSSTAANGSGQPGRPQVRRIDSQPVEPVDLIGTAGAPLVRRLVPVVAALVVVYLLIRRRR